MKIEQPLRLDDDPFVAVFNLQTKTKGGITHMTRCRHGNRDPALEERLRSLAIFFQPLCLIPVSHYGKLLSCTESVTVCLCPLIRDLYLQSDLVNLKRNLDGEMHTYNVAMPHKDMTAGKHSTLCAFSVYVSRKIARQRDC